MDGGNLCAVSVDPHDSRMPRRRSRIRCGRYLARVGLLAGATVDAIDRREHRRCVMSDNRWRGWLIAIAIFVLGVGVGGAGMAWAGIRVFRHVIQNQNSPHGGLADRAAEYI